MIENRSHRLSGTKKESMSPSHDLAELERELEGLKKQLPRHSISPSILARIDELEEEIAMLKQAEEGG